MCLTHTFFYPEIHLKALVNMIHVLETLHEVQHAQLIIIPCFIFFSYLSLTVMFIEVQNREMFEINLILLRFVTDMYL